MTPGTELKSKRSQLVWNILFVLALAVIAGSAGILALAFSHGGMMKVAAWYLFQLVPPALGLITLVLVLANVGFTRGLTKTALVTGTVSLAAMAPALLMVFPVTYPASIKKMSPSATVRLPADVPLKVGWGGDHQKVSAHAFVPDQRCAPQRRVQLGMLSP